MASAFALAPLITLQPRLEVRLELAQEPRPTTPAQLYFDIGKGFTETDSKLLHVPSRSLKDFQPVWFQLPSRFVAHLRFDPAKEEGTFAIRKVEIWNGPRLLYRVPLAQLQPSHDISTRRIVQDSVVLQTTPGAEDPRVLVNLPRPLRARWGFAQGKVRQCGALEFLVVLGTLCALVYPRLPPAVVRPVHDRIYRTHTFFDRSARTLSSGKFLPLDAAALWFYIACSVCFGLAVVSDLNGSSTSIYSQNYGIGMRETVLLGAPRQIRSDEWAYSTPDVLSQALRADRFALQTTDLGGHSVALTANVPVKHVSTFFRPQFWGFFILPADFGYSFFWQAKALLLVSGIFTWLLWLTRSTLWSATGALWYLFSPFTQWTYSWPSALPEMVGSGCLATVCFAYLLVGRRTWMLCIAGVGAAVFWIDFALCGYPPHLIPFAWLQIFVIVAWTVAQGRALVRTEGSTVRLTVIVLALAVAAAVGASTYRDLAAAASAIAETSYPGHRIVGGGLMSGWTFLAHFLPWSLTEAHFPEALGNLSEGSGFLWLAPIALLCLFARQFTRSQKACLVGLWIIALILLAWEVLPLSPQLGAPMLLNRTLGSRLLPALGLANIAIVAIAMSGGKRAGKREGAIGRSDRTSVVVLTFSGAFLLSFLLLQPHVQHFFSSREMVWASIVAGGCSALLVLHRPYALAALLLVSHAVAFGTVNPVKRGMQVFLGSDLYRFLHSNPDYTRQRWLIYSTAIERSGFFAAAGGEIYTGTRYLPDIDHFPLLRSRGVDIALLNRLGYLTAMPIARDKQTSVSLINPLILEWDVAPNDPLLKQVGLRYVAFAEEPDPDLVQGLRRLSDRPIDGYWLFGL